ncbi:MAG: FAD-dependent oxidoreductase [Burkholderiales bacterium]|nr:FAD-dependent oxidoreductase [Burkholderiales bacterium]
MPPTRLTILGGGLAGLYAAYLLEQHGIHDYLLIEARPRWGGRIDAASSGADAFDLGPTWFWPALQPQLDHLVRDLGLASFAQHEAGDMVVERSPNAPAMRTRGYLSSPRSMRLAGGMGALVAALQRRLDPARLLAGHTVRRLACGGAQVDLEVVAADGQTTSLRAGQVLLALPPRLAATTLQFAPALPEALARAWRGTATWMAPHAKYLAVYDTPFWREQGLSGEARSACGPMAEIHDASAASGGAALFGFLGLPAQVRSSVPEDVLRAHCRAQLARLFGPRAALPQAEFLKDWASDPFTATAADLQGGGEHADAPPAGVPSGPWRGRIVGIASEWSPQFPGYLAGAVEAADLGVRAALLSEGHAAR